MGQEQEVTLMRAAWCAEAEAALMPAAFGDMPFIRAEVLDGVCDLWRATGASDGWVVTRQEPGEVVIVLGAGRNCLPVIQHITARAKAAGLTLRTHIRRKGMQRIFERAGFRPRELVMGA